MTKRKNESGWEATDEIHDHWRFFVGMAPTAYAQQAPKPAVPQPGAPMAAPKPTAPAAPAAQVEAAKFLVFFDWDKATLTPEARRVIASAAEEKQRRRNDRQKLIPRHWSSPSNRRSNAGS